MEGKVCTKCGVWKPLEEYYKKKTSKDGRESRCKGCRNEDWKQRWSKKHPKKIKEVREGMKKCTQCGVWKPLEEFNKNKIYKDGRQYKCRECQKEYAKQYRENNPEYSKQWRENNPEYSKQWKENNPEYHKQWRENNSEQQKQWRENNKENKREYDKQYRQDNAEHIKEYNKQWYDDIKENNLKYISSIVEQINPVMKDLPVYGYIYKFENIKTGHVYIGQTTYPLKMRYGFEGGIIKSWIKERREKVTQKFIEELIEEEFEVKELFDVACCKYHLDKLEAYWINKYDSCNNGYNNEYGNHNTNDGLEEFNRLLSTHNLEYKDGKIIKKPTSTNEID